MSRLAIALDAPWVLWAVAGALAAATLGMLSVLDPRAPGNYPPCPFLFFTGCYCPGCGTLRALQRLLHGDVPGALGYNPMTTLGIPALAVVGIRDAARALGWQRWLPARPLSHRAAWGLLAAILAFWVARNIPVHPFTALAP